MIDDGVSNSYEMNSFFYVNSYFYPDILEKMNSKFCFLLNILYVFTYLRAFPLFFFLYILLNFSFLTHKYPRSLECFKDNR